MEFDIRTLAFVATFSSVLMALSLGTLWWVNRSEKSTAYWLAGSVLMAIGFLFIGFRHIITPFWSIIIANLAILCGYCFHYAGVQTFVGKQIPVKRLFLLIFCIGIGFVYYTYFNAHVGARIVLISWSIALVTAASTLSLVNDIRKNFSVSEAFVALFFLIYSTFMVARGVFSLAETGVSDFMSAGFVHAISLILIMLLSMTLSIGYSVMVTGNLNVKLKISNEELALQKRALEDQTQELVRLTEDLQAAKEHAELLSMTDNLTGLFNRHKLDQAFTEEFDRSQRYGHTFSAIMFDLDHFKNVNDIYGHQVGDEFLIAVSQIIKDDVRQSDIPGRWGGEEFLVICPATNIVGAQALAEKIRQKIEQHAFSVVGQQTASFGVAERKEEDTIASLTRRADEALYRAKKSGRNQVQIG